MPALIARRFLAALLTAAILAACSISRTEDPTNPQGPLENLQPAPSSETRAPWTGARPMLAGKAEALAEKLEARSWLVQDAIAAMQEARDCPEARAELRKILDDCMTRADEDGISTRFLVPACGVDVALVEMDATVASSELLQQVVDAEDLGALMTGTPWAGAVLADHRAQGFDGLLTARPGTRAWLCTKDQTIPLYCALAENGGNDGTLRRSDGKEADAPFPILAYTCKQDDRKVRLVWWEVFEK